MKIRTLAASSSDGRVLNNGSILDFSGKIAGMVERCKAFNSSISSGNILPHILMRRNTFDTFRLMHVFSRKGDYQMLTNQETILGTFNHSPRDVSDRPLWVLGNDLPDSFLSEEISFGKAVGSYFYLSDLANMWHDIAFVKALMKHPEALVPLKTVIRRYKIKVNPIQIKDFIHLLNVTDEYLFENQVDTVEDLVMKVAKKKMTTPSDLVKNDLDTAFRSFYGVGLNLSA